MRHRVLIAALCVPLIAGIVARCASAQDGQTLRERRAASLENAAQRNGVSSPGGERGQPNMRAMAGLPPKWVEKVRDMPPEQQQRFMENNAQFQSLAPERQEQIRKNLQKWNNLSPEQKQQARNAEAALERMTPEQRQYVRSTLLPKWQAMPQERRQVISHHLAMLREMSPGTQQAALSDPKFMRGLSPDEQSMLRDLNSLRNPPTE